MGVSDSTIKIYRNDIIRNSPSNRNTAGASVKTFRESAKLKGKRTFKDFLWPLRKWMAANLRLTVLLMKPTSLFLRITNEENKVKTLTEIKLKEKKTRVGIL